GMDVGSVSIPSLLARYLRMFALGRKHRVVTSSGQFVARLLEHFGLLIEERLQGLTVTMSNSPKGAEDAHVVNEGALVVPAPVLAPQPPAAAGPARIMA
nr:hypothetical protein [Tanacetum cinerariifolium]